MFKKIFIIPNYNKDENLYECPMDWNVIADHEGECPTCGMKLKEFSIAEVQNNLTKYGYEYKSERSFNLL